MNVEELKSMTHEDLVRRIQEIEEENNKLKSDKEGWVKSWSDLNNKFEALKSTIKGIVSLVE